ncbi:MAG: short-chain dehydrogenase [Deltaproteobacteria bacterium RBG_13_52_11]|nr:MAG: short-chain dehydrogenase [Deltaproteobacteria bacterium RBG_13_52_11]
MKTVFITGANRGIGFETARQLAQLDYFVYIGSRDKEKGQRAKQELQGSGLRNVDALELDVTNLDSIKKARRILETKATKLDVLINNAGMRGEVPQRASHIPIEVLREVFETNFFGVIQVTQEFIPLLKKSQVPVIVNVTSDIGSLTLRSDTGWKHYKIERAAYGPSKTALNAYTVALATELKDSKFKVNSVNPGYTATEFNNYTGTKPVAQGAAVIVKYATLDENGPTGKFFSEEGETPW